MSNARKLSKFLQEGGEVDTDTLVVDSTNNRVGMGTDSPDKTLHVYHATTNKPALIESGDAFSLLEFKDSSTTNIPAIGADGDNIIIQTGPLGTQRMRIDSSGDVSISGFYTDNPVSTTDTGEGFFFSGSSLKYSFFARNSTSANIYIAKTDGTTSGEAIRFMTDGNDVGSINLTSSSTSYTESSDYRLKENVTGITDGITRVKQLNPSRFNFITDSDTTVDGFLAHEAQTVVPEAVTGTHNEVETWTQDEIDSGDAPANTSAGDNKLDGEGNTIPVYQGIDKSKLVPLLTAALQEAIAKIEALETRIAALEAN